MKIAARTKRKLIWTLIAFLIFYFTVIEYGHTHNVWWSLGFAFRMVCLVWVGKYLRTLEQERT